MPSSLRTLELLTAPALPLLTDVELKSHLRVDLADDDALIQDIGLAAQTIAENFTRRKFIDQTWKLYIRDGFDPDKDGRIYLPFAPLSSVTSVKYLDSTGTEQTWDAADYQVVKPVGPQAMPGYIELAYGASFPSVRGAYNSVYIEFVAGYGTVGSNDVPESLIAAVRLHAGTLYENRESVIVGTIAQRLPDSVKALLMPFRVDL